MRTPLLAAASVATRRCSTLHAKHAQIRWFTLTCMMTGVLRQVQLCVSCYYILTRTQPL